MSESIGIVILGGTGYGAGEMLRLLSLHPKAELRAVVSSSMKGARISEAHPHLKGFYDDVFLEKLDFNLLKDCDQKVIVTALPHGTAGKTVCELLPQAVEENVKIVDLSGDLRLQDENQRQIFYPEAAVSAEVQGRFVYGLTELNREAIAKTQFIANPGCFATTCALAVAPIVGRAFSAPIVFDGKSGSSGAGRSPQAAFHHPDRHGNANAYKVLSHRHEPEIRQALGDPAGSRLQTAFVPHVIPTSRGIYVTAHLFMKESVSRKELMDCYSSFYSDSPFIRLRDAVPELQNVLASNFCDIFLEVRDRQLTAIAALDNLVKGMCGQAIQNINLMCGLPETTGLFYPPCRPI